MKFAIRFFEINLILLIFCNSAIAEEEVSDPIEPVNRAVFWFNDKLDIYLLEPIATGYDYVLPDPAQRGVTNFFDNLSFPVYFVGDLLQLKFDQAIKHSGRFFLNTTVGLGGFIDIAKEYGLPKHQEDIGSALGYWGVPEGPYIVIPILGPSNARDLFGRVGDKLLTPTTYIYYGGVPSSDQELYISTIPTVLQGIQTRANLLEAVRDGKGMSIDYYTFVRNSYHQHRQGVIFDGMPPEDDYEYEE